ncbi:hypothetical protein D3C85_1250810 [compost metagenome]
MRWLRELRVKQLEANDSEGQLLTKLIAFLNKSDLLPHGAQIAEVRSEEVVIVDAAGAKVIVEQMSDGYRSVLSMIFEILRQMTKSYGILETMNSMDIEMACVNLTGIVAIDEVDAHLHPSWQKEIGPWFVKCFPLVQFVVTTHSPIICRNATSVWRLPNPGSNEEAGRVEGVTLNRLIYGSILDAYGTEFFGHDISRSDESKKMLEDLAVLNRKALKGTATEIERQRIAQLRSALPTQATNLPEA